MSRNDDPNNDIRRVEKRLDLLIGMVETLAADLQNVKDDLRNVKDDLRNVKDDLHGVKIRLENLENTVNERLHDTRPMWERTLAEIAELKSEMQEGFYNFGTRIELLLRDMFALRTDHERLSRRVDDLRSEAT
jgi:chromosome segregation ATPase